MRRIAIHIALVLPMLLLTATEGYCQLNAELIVYNALKKKTEPAFATHTVVEGLNAKAHKSTMERTQEFREASDSLGFYYKAFNWVDIAFNALRFAMNVKNTYDVANKRIDGIVSLIKVYEDECLKHGDIEADDQEIIDIGRDMYNEVKQDVNSIINTSTAIVGYIGLQFPCTTFSMLNDLKTLNNSLEHIQYSLNNAYMRLYFFMVSRTGFRWNIAYTPVDRVSIAEGAIGRWKSAAQQSLTKMPGATE